MKISEILHESGLSRAHAATRKHDYGTITAFRFARDCGTGKPYSHHENTKRNKSLLAKLRAAGYGVTSIKGSYIENFGTDNAREVSENSFLVIDRQNSWDLKETLMALGHHFEQDSIIFGKAGEVGTLIGTNHCEDGYPGYHVEVPQGGVLFGKSGAFMSRVSGRPFVFAESVELIEYGVAKYPTELRGAVATAAKNWEDL